MPSSAHPEIRKVRRNGHTTAIHGNKLWKSSCLLIDYLHKNPPEHTTRVLDVGCGWGIAGIWCARFLDSKVTSVDADAGVFPFLEATAKLNHVTAQTRTARFEDLTIAELSQYDMLIAADICFWDELIDPVSNLVNRAVRAGVKHIFIADPERGPFFDMAERCIERHCAEIIPWETLSPIKSRGAIMVLENA